MTIMYCLEVHYYIYVIYMIWYEHILLYWLYIVVGFYIWFVLQIILKDRYAWKYSNMSSIKVAIRSEKWRTAALNTNIQCQTTKINFSNISLLLLITYITWHPPNSKSPDSVHIHKNEVHPTLEEKWLCKRMNKISSHCFFERAFLLPSKILSVEGHFFFIM